MITFEVNDMTCGHCVSSITRAVHGADPGARVSTDLATHRVEIDSTAANAGELSQAIKDAGFTPVAVEGSACHAGAPAAGKGCCCG